MSLPVLFRSEAQDDVLAARTWYGQRREGLGEEFVAAMDEVLTRIAATPEIHELVIRDVRRGMMRRFPYVVYYRLLPDRIEVLAVLHGRRNPATWAIWRDPDS